MSCGQMSLARLYGKRSRNIQIAIEGLGKLKKSTLAAEAKDLCRMSDIAKAMFFSHNFRPFFNSTAFNFNGISTSFTDEVMMVGISAQAIDSFTIIASK
jgi:hypothetical protein